MTKRGEQEVGAPKEWAEPPAAPEKVASADLPAWREAADTLRAVAVRDGLSMADVSRRADIPQGTLSPWYRGLYPGVTANVTAKVVRWIEAHEEGRSLDARIPAEPGFVRTKTAEEIFNALFLAQKLPDIAFVTLGSGMGKTITARHFAGSRPGVYFCTMRPTTGAPTTMLQELAQALDLAERNPVALDRAIGAKLRRNGRETLLIVDEAQNLTDKAVDQLRHFHDEYQCGLALLGNDELYTRFGKGEPKAGYGQISRRTGTRLGRLKPLDADIEALIDAWAVEDQAIRKLLRAIGRKPGSLGQISKTMKLAGILAAMDGKPLGIGYVNAAWENRGGEAH
jgi:DNA transposition AAA+ family ATPase